MTKSINYTELELMLDKEEEKKNQERLICKLESNDKSLATESAISEEQSKMSGEVEIAC